MSNDYQDARQYERLKTTSYQPEKGAKPTVKPSKTGQMSIGKKIGVAFLVLLAALVLFTGSLMAWSYRNFTVMSEKTFSGQSAFQLYPASPLATDTSGRTNVLIVGEDGPGGLTDTILLLSLDGEDGAYMLSIPRDLYVEIPGYGAGKINEAYPAGERHDFSESGYRSGGIGLLEKVLAENLGIDTHYYVVTNFSAVERVVDALGGIEVEIDSPDDRGLYDPNFQPHEGGPLQLENGIQEIDGQTALRLTRARGSAGGYGFPQSDFNRTKNQQRVVSGIADSLDWRVALDPRVNRALFEAIADTVETDLQMNEVLPMYRALTRTPIEEMDSYTLRDIDGVNLLTDFTTHTGLSALVPASGYEQYDQIQQAIQSIHR